MCEEGFLTVSSYSSHSGSLSSDLVLFKNPLTELRKWEGNDVLVLP